jgi:arylsulfatase A-like enzyme
MNRPNVLLVVLDTARADACSPYAPQRATPTMGQLAASGIAHPRVIAPSCWTVPSHAAFLLGGPPRSVGICHIGGPNGTAVGPTIRRQLDRYLPAVLRRNGYSTIGISANGWISESRGFSYGFDEFHEVAAERQKRMGQAGRRGTIAWYAEAMRATADDGAALVEQRLTNWLDTQTSSPFFCFVNLIECHSPYLPPKPFATTGPLGRVVAARDYRKYYTFEGLLKSLATAQVPSQTSLRRMRGMYDASVSLMDAWLARVLEYLDRRRVLDDTIVIVTSDHGENFGDDGLIGHGGSLDDRLLWVPFVIRGPNVRANAELMRPGVMSLDSLPRIIASLVDIDHPWTQRGEPGVAIAQYDGPVEAGALEEAWSDLPLSPDRLRRLSQRYTCATDGRSKLVRSEDETVLYDLENDPLELAPRRVPATTGEDVQKLIGELDRADAERQPEMGGQQEEMAPELEARMRLLGYL